MTTQADGGRTAIVLGLFAALWFSWTPDASGTLSVLLRIGGIAALVVAVIGIGVTVRSRGTSDAFRQDGTTQRYLAVVLLELVLAGAGASVLALVDADRYVPVWVCGVVGVHFFPLASVLRAPPLRVLGTVLVAVAAIGLVVGVVGDITPSTVTGTGAGAALLIAAIGALVGPSAVGRTDRTPG